MVGRTLQPYGGYERLVVGRSVAHGGLRTVQVVVEFQDVRRSSVRAGSERAVGPGPSAGSVPGPARAARAADIDRQLTEVHSPSPVATPVRTLTPFITA